MKNFENKIDDLQNQIKDLYDIYLNLSERFFKLSLKLKNLEEFWYED